MSYFVVDIEADGPIPGDYSMVSFGVVKLTKELDKTYYAEIKPISEKYNKNALTSCNFSREQTLSFSDPISVMKEFYTWIKNNNTSYRPLFLSDNNGFDWQFINWYFHHFLNENPFGYSSLNISCLFKGIKKNTHSNFKYLRNTKHTHNALDDAKGNAEAVLKMISSFGLKIDLD